jgi:hypothetical protein
MSGEPRGENQELDADRYAAVYLASPPLNWSKEKLLQALAALDLPPEARGTHPSLDNRREQVVAGYERAHHPVTNPLGGILITGCPDGARAIIDDVGQDSVASGGRLEIASVLPGEHQIRTVKAGYKSSVQYITAESGRGAVIPCGLIPDLKGSWVFVQPSPKIQFECELGTEPTKEGFGTVTDIGGGVVAGITIELSGTVRLRTDGNCSGSRGGKVDGAQVELGFWSTKGTSRAVLRPNDALAALSGTYTSITDGVPRIIVLIRQQ